MTTNRRYCSFLGMHCAPPASAPVMAAPQSLPLRDEAYVYRLCLNVGTRQLIVADLHSFGSEVEVYLHAEGTYRRGLGWADARARPA